MDPTRTTADDRSEGLLRSHHAAASSVLRYSAVAPVRVDGWLAKEGKALRTRRTRFIRLHGHVLTSHRTKASPPSWHVSVTHAVVEKGSHPREIKLSLPQRVISFVAPTQAAFDKWIVGLRRASLVSSRVEDFYRIGRLIGEGMNGQVHLAQDLITEEQVAVKMVPRLGRENETRFLAREVQIILSVTHPNIVRTIDVFVRSRRVHFVMEYLQGGELFDFIAENTNFTETHAATVLADLLRALSYLHARGIAHRDVKLENLLCANTSWPLHVKLADFGFANYVNGGEHSVLSSFVGTPYYIAPEMLRGDPHGCPVDVWASGVVMYILLSGKFPFGGKNESEYYQRVLSKEAYFPAEEWSNVSEDAKDLVRGMLCKDPNKRLTAVECLRHPWLQRAESFDEIQSDLEEFPMDAVSAFRPIVAMPDPNAKPPPPVLTSLPPPSLQTPSPPDSGHILAPTTWNTEPTAVEAVAEVQVATEKQHFLHSPRVFKDNREKRGKRRYLGMLNHSVTSPTDGVLSTRQSDKNGPTKRVSNSDPAANRDSELADAVLTEGAEDPTVNRRPSLIRRLLSSGKLSLDRYDGRFPSFRGGVDDPSDEASSQPRKTLSLFARDGPLRRSFHRVGEGRASNDGIPFVNSQSQKLPPKVARERQRQQRQAEAMRKSTRPGGIFSARGKNTTHQFNVQHEGYHSSPRLQAPAFHPLSAMPAPPGQRASINNMMNKRRCFPEVSREEERAGKMSSLRNMSTEGGLSADGTVRRTMSADVTPFDRMARSHFVTPENFTGKFKRSR